MRLLSGLEQWVNQSGSSEYTEITLPISFTNIGTVVGMDGSVLSIHYAAYVSSLSKFTIITNTTGDWGFRGIIIGI